MANRADVPTPPEGSEEEIPVPDDPVFSTEPASEDDALFNLLNSDTTPLGDLTADEQTPEVEQQEEPAGEPAGDEGLPPGGTGEDGGPPPASSPITSDDLAALWRDTYGSDPTPDAVAQNFQIAQQLAQLSPAQRAAIEQVLTGQYPQPPTPPTPPAFEQPTVPPQQPQHPGVPAPAQPVVDPSLIAPPTIEIPDYVDPETRQAFEAQQAYNQQIAALHQQTMAQLAQIQQAEQARVQQQLAEENARIQQAAADARSQFREAYPELTDGEFARVLSAAASNPNFDAIYRQTGDATAACRQLLDGALFSHKDIYDRVNDARVQAKVDVALAERTRKEKASAVSGPAAAGSPTVTKGQPPGRDDALRALADGALEGV